MSREPRGLLPTARLQAARLACALALVLCSSRALGQGALERASSEQTVALSWAGPGPELVCLGEDGLARAVNEYLGRDAFARDAVALVLHVGVERLPDRTWRARLELSDPAGHVLGVREISSKGELCSDLNESLVLAVALMVDDEPPAPSPPPPPQPPAEALAPPAPPEHRRGTAGSAWLAADGSLALAAGLLPSASPGLDLGVELGAAPWLTARLSVAGLLPAKTSLESGASVRFTLLATGLALCPGLAPAHGWRLTACAGPVFGALLARSRGLAGARSAERRFLGATVGARAALPLGGRWSLVAQLSGVIPHRPERFVYELNGVRREVFRPAELSVVATAGVSVMF